MSELNIFVDFDNIENKFLCGGPIALSRTIAAIVPLEIISGYLGITVRLYGGWRWNGNLTHQAQYLIPKIRAGSPGVIPIKIDNAVINFRLRVELAEKPIGYSNLLGRTFVKERSLRKFRVKSTPWDGCTSSGSCGLSHLNSATHATKCPDPSCAVMMGSILIRDEQKMVDTLIVADIAQLALVDKAKNIVVVSSDTDMWPGVILALRAGCSILHIHPKSQWKTQQHLLNTLTSSISKKYSQLSL